MNFMFIETALAQAISVGTGATTGLVNSAAAGGGQAFTNFMVVASILIPLILFLFGLDMCLLVIKSGGNLVFTGGTGMGGRGKGVSDFDYIANKASLIGDRYGNTIEFGGKRYSEDDAPLAAFDKEEYQRIKKRQLNYERQARKRHKQSLKWQGYLKRSNKQLFTGRKKREVEPGGLPF